MDIVKEVKKKYGVNKLFSFENVKSSKSSEYGYYNGIQYLLHADIGKEYGIKNMCAFATSGCKSMCFGGVKRQAMSPNMNAKKNRSLLFQNDKELYLKFYIHEVFQAIKSAKNKGLGLVLRLNGTSDKDFEKLGYYNIFPQVQFCEYTKNVILVKKYLRGDCPSNLNLTLSRSEKNHEFCLECLKDGGINVAIPFGGDLPKEWNGYEVIDGDKHDLRFLDGTGGKVIGLKFKNYAKNLASGIQSGFIQAGEMNMEVKIGEKSEDVKFESI